MDLTVKVTENKQQNKICDKLPLGMFK